MMAVSRPKTEKSRFDLQEIKKLIELIERSPITEFELVDKELRVRISKNGGGGTGAREMIMPVLPSSASAAPAVPVAAIAAPPVETKKQLYELKSPMVGTFYRSPSPDAEAYVRVGDTVEPGKVLCIVEAMKLMNELESEVRGRIAEICIENAQPVEFGQVLFRIDTSAV
jgi:acetyl-CoA carboxylase biotin carboxyl carrier protein